MRLFVNTVWFLNTQRCVCEANLVNRRSITQFKLPRFFQLLHNTFQTTSTLRFVCVKGWLRGVGCTGSNARVCDLAGFSCFWVFSTPHIHTHPQTHIHSHTHIHAHPHSHAHAYRTRTPTYTRTQARHTLCAEIYAAYQFNTSLFNRSERNKSITGLKSMLVVYSTRFC